MRWHAWAVLSMAACSMAAGCGREGRAARDSAATDTTRAGAMPDSVAAPRVVPYDPSSPGAMRNGDSVIKARAPEPAVPTTRAPRVPAPVGRASTPNPATPSSTPVPGPARADSVGDPATIVRDYYAAIRAHDFLRAYRMWELSGQTGARSYAQFAAGFDSTESVDVRIGAAGLVEGAAGSRFVTVPVEIDSRLRNGTRQRFTGTYTLRRVEVPGASAAQRRWHLYAANIRQVQ